MAVCLTVFFNSELFNITFLQKWIPTPDLLFFAKMDSNSRFTESNKPGIKELL